MTAVNFKFARQDGSDEASGHVLFRQTGRTVDAGSVLSYRQWADTNANGEGSIELDAGTYDVRVFRDSKLIMRGDANIPDRDQIFLHDYWPVQLALQLIDGDQMADILQFTRNSTATYWDSAGILRTAEVDEPRWDYDPATGLFRGLLVEQSRTNLVQRNNELDTSPWSATSVDISESVDFRGFKLFKIESESDANSATRNTQDVDIEAGANSILLVAKRGDVGSGHITFGFRSGGAFDNSLTVQFDPESGEWVNGGVESFTPSEGLITKQLDSDTWLLGFKFEADNTGVATLALFADRLDAGIGRNTWFGIPQVEKGVYPTSPILTAGSAVTRAADDVRISAANVAAQLGDLSEGTFVIGLESRGVDASGSNLILSNGSGGHFAYRNTGDPLSIIRSFDGTDADSVTVDEEVRKYAIAWSGDSRSMSANGSPASVDPWVGAWASGDLRIGGTNCDVWVNYLKFLPRRMSDAELPTETAL